MFKKLWIFLIILFLLSSCFNNKNNNKNSLENEKRVFSNDTTKALDKSKFPEIWNIDENGR